MNRQFDNLTSVFYQLSHATIYVIRFLGLPARVTSTGTQRIGLALYAASLTAKMIIARRGAFVNTSAKKVLNISANQVLNISKEKRHGSVGVPAGFCMEPK